MNQHPYGMPALQVSEVSSGGLVCVVHAASPSSWSVDPSPAVGPPWGPPARGEADVGELYRGTLGRAAQENTWRALGKHGFGRSGRLLQAKKAVKEAGSSKESLQGEAAAGRGESPPHSRCGGSLAFLWQRR